MKTKQTLRQLPGGMQWQSDLNSSVPGAMATADHDYQILPTKAGKFRLIAFNHDSSPQFPDAEFWMREYETMRAAMEQAEVM